MSLDPKVYNPIWRYGGQLARDNMSYATGPSGLTGVTGATGATGPTGPTGPGP